MRVFPSLRLASCPPFDVVQGKAFLADERWREGVAGRIKMYRYSPGGLTRNRSRQRHEYYRNLPPMVRQSAVLTRSPWVRSSTISRPEWGEGLSQWPKILCHPASPPAHLRQWRLKGYVGRGQVFGRKSWPGFAILRTFGGIRVIVGISGSVFLFKPADITPRRERRSDRRWIIGPIARSNGVAAKLRPDASCSSPSYLKKCGRLTCVARGS